VRLPLRHGRFENTSRRELLIESSPMTRMHYACRRFHVSFTLQCVLGSKSMNGVGASPPN